MHAFELTFWDDASFATLVAAAFPYSALPKRLELDAWENHYAPHNGEPPGKRNQD